MTAARKSVLAISEFCDLHHASPSSREWALGTGCQTMAELWRRDDLSPERQLWIATRPGVMSNRDLRLFACWCVRQVWHLLPDERSRNAVEAAEQYAEGKATVDVLVAARDAAEAAAEVAAWVAARVAWAAWAVAWDAAWVAAGEAAGAAARAAWAAAEAAEAAAEVAAWVAWAKWAVVWAAKEVAAWDAWAKWAAARDAAEAAQSTQLKSYTVNFSRPGGREAMSDFKKTRPRKGRRGNEHQARTATAG